jgi:hypothetical protein
MSDTQLTPISHQHRVLFGGALELQVYRQTSSTTTRPDRCPECGAVGPDGHPEHCPNYGESYRPESKDEFRVGLIVNGGLPSLLPIAWTYEDEAREAMDGLTGADDEHMRLLNEAPIA